MLVRDVMTQGPVVGQLDEPLRAAASRMWSSQTGGLLVVAGDQLLGILTERDVLSAVARGLDLDATPVQAVMTSPVLTTPPDVPVVDAARTMAQHRVRHLPVVDAGQLLGVVTQRAVVAVLADLAQPRAVDLVAESS